MNYIPPPKLHGILDESKQFRVHDLLLGERKHIYGHMLKANNLILGEFIERGFCL